MSHSILPESVSSNFLDTPRLRVHFLRQGPDGGVPVVLLHGNLSSSLLWDETLGALPERYRGLAIDMRGFGDSETKPIDATRGLSDFAEDLRSFIETVGLREKVHLVGHSTGGGVIMQYAIDYPAAVASLILVDSVSPYGFGGTKGTAGTPNPPDFAGSGAGVIAPELLERLRAGDMSAESDLSPRSIMNTFYWKPPYRVSPEREDAFVAAILKSSAGDKNFPGDVTTSENWPGTAPGQSGVNNAISGKYFNASGMVDIDPKPPILWIHGADDQVVSDTSLFDIAYLGQLGAIPGWPGEDAFPPQPMKQQMRAVLDQYQANGGWYRELVIAESGHSPFIDQPEAFQKAFFGFLAEQG